MVLDDPFLTVAHFLCLFGFFLLSFPPSALVTTVLRKVWYATVLNWLQ